MAIAGVRFSIFLLLSSMSGGDGIADSSSMVKGFPSR